MKKQTSGRVEVIEAEDAESAVDRALRDTARKARAKAKQEGTAPQPRVSQEIDRRGLVSVELPGGVRRMIHVDPGAIRDARRWGDRQPAAQLIHEDGDMNNARYAVHVEVLGESSVVYFRDAKGMANGGSVSVGIETTAPLRLWVENKAWANQTYPVTAGCGAHSEEI